MFFLGFFYFYTQKCYIIENAKHHLDCYISWTKRGTGKVFKKVQNKRIKVNL